jgi:hypothetical protein
MRRMRRRRGNASEQHKKFEILSLSGTPTNAGGSAAKIVVR